MRVDGDTAAVGIGGRRVGDGFPPLVIAEMSGNHNRSLERALQIVDAAAHAGAHAVKLQTYTADTMTLDLPDAPFRIADPGSPWNGKTLYQLYREAHTPWQWHRPIFERCRELGMIGFSSAFDASAVDFLESLEVPCYKIASFENVDLPLIRKVASTGKPLIMSTGMASLAELDEAVQAARGAGCRELILLKCTSSYPAPVQDSNLLTIPHLRELFGCPVGLSDHTLGAGAAVASVALGAAAIEKHLTLRRSDGGVDAAFSLEPPELEMLVREVEDAWRALGRVQYGPSPAERGLLAFRRSLYIVRDMRAGEQLSGENLRALRPGVGLPPKFYDLLIGRCVRRDVKQGTAVTWDLVS